MSRREASSLLMRGRLAFMTRFDGSMTQARREAVIALFSIPLPDKQKKKKKVAVEDPKAKGKKKVEEEPEIPSVMLISLKVCCTPHIGPPLTAIADVMLFGQAGALGLKCVNRRSVRCGICFD